MSSKMLYEAIALVRAGRNDDARLVIFEIIRNEPQNEMAWMWLAETLSSDVDRMKVLIACLRQNPGSKIAQMAIDKMKNKMGTAILQMDEETPFTEGATYDPLAANRTGHTGAIIGFDGSFILSEVPDFNDVIDLRSPGSGTESLIADSTPTVIPMQPPVSTPDISDLEIEDYEHTQPETEDTQPAQPEPAFEESLPGAQPTKDEPVELEYEPDLSELFEDDQPFKKFEEQPKEEEEDFDLSRILSSPTVTPDEDLINLDELSPEELGFIDETSPRPFTNPQAENDQGLHNLFAEGELVEDHVVESSVKKYSAKRKKQERQMLYLVGGIFGLIAVLCIAMVWVLFTYSQRGTKLAPVPTQTLIVPAVIEPTASPTHVPSATATALPTATATALPTATPLVYLSEDAIDPLTVGSLELRMQSPLEGAFYTSLDGSLVAIPQGNDIQLWSTAAGKQRFTLQGHSAAITDVVFSADSNLLVSASRDFTVRVWATQTGALIKSIALDAEAINRIYADRTKQYPRSVSVDISPDGGTLAAGAYGFVNVIDLPTGLLRGTFVLGDEKLAQLSKDVPQLTGFQVKFNENGWVLSAAMSKLLVGLDSLDATPLYQYDLGPFAQVSFAANRLNLVEADSGGITLRSLENGEILNGFAGRKDKPNQAAPEVQISDNGQTLGIEADSSTKTLQLEVWNIPNDQNAINFDGICENENCRMPAYALSPDGSWIALEALLDEITSLKIIDIASGTELHSFNGLAAPIADVSVSPDGKLVAALDGSGIVHVWDVEIGVERAAIQTSAQTNLSFSRDGALLSAWGSKNLMVWSKAVPPPVGTIPGIDAAQLADYLMKQSTSVNCAPGGAEVHQNQLAQQCNLEASSYMLSNAFTYDADGHVFLLQTDLTMKSAAAVDETTSTAFAYSAAFPYGNSQPSEAQAWVKAQLKTIKLDESQEISYGVVRFILTRSTAGYSLSMQIPAAAS